MLIRSEGKPKKGILISWNKWFSSCVVTLKAKSIQMQQTCMSELLQQRAESAQRQERDAAEMSNYMLSRTVAEQEILNLRRELAESNTRLKNTSNHLALEAEQRANQRVQQVTRQYEERFAELRTSLETECKKVVDDTISFAKSGMEGFRKEESAAMTELREECKKQENRAAELNAQLQDRVDELMEKLNKYSAPVFHVEEVGQDEEGIPVEVYATPRAEHATNSWGRSQASRCHVKPSRSCKRTTAKFVFHNSCRVGMLRLYFHHCQCDRIHAKTQTASPACVVPQLQPVSPTSRRQ